MVGMFPHCQAFFVGQTRLLYVDIEAANSSDDTHGGMLSPTGVRIGDQTIAFVQAGANLVNALDVQVGITANFELKTRVSLAFVLRDILRHLFGALLRNGAVQADALAKSSSQQLADGQSGCFAEYIQQAMSIPAFT